MEYQHHITIKAPLRDVFTKFCNPDNLRHWQRGFRNWEHVSGRPDQEGARTKLIYLFGDRKLELVQTIDKLNAPYEISVTYNSEGMDNIQTNAFSENDAGDTNWISTNEFIPLNFKMRLFTIFFPSTFKKQSKKYMLDFKNFVQDNTSVNNQ